MAENREASEKSEPARNGKMSADCDEDESGTLRNKRKLGISFRRKRSKNKTAMETPIVTGKDAHREQMVVSDESPCNKLATSQARDDPQTLEDDVADDEIKEGDVDQLAHHRTELSTEVGGEKKTRRRFSDRLRASRKRLRRRSKLAEEDQVVEPSQDYKLENKFTETEFIKDNEAFSGEEEETPAGPIEEMPEKCSEESNVPESIGPDSIDTQLCTLLNADRESDLGIHQETERISPKLITSHDDLKDEPVKDLTWVGAERVYDLPEIDKTPPGMVSDLTGVTSIWDSADESRLQIEERDVARVMDNSAEPDSISQADGKDDLEEDQTLPGESNLSEKGVAEQVGASHKEESFLLARKAVKAYKQAHLSRRYCASCCSLL